MPRSLGDRLVDTLGKTGNGLIRVTLANGTAAATDVTVTGMTTKCKILAVLSFTTAAAIASVADRKSEYVAGAGKLVKAAGTNETNNQLLVLWMDLA